MTSIAKGANMPVPATALTVSVTWQAGPGSPDVDVSALLLGASGKVSSDADMVFYNQPAHSSGAVAHTGKTPGRDAVQVNLPALPASVDRVVVAASSDGGTFGSVPALALTVTDAVDNQLARFDITDATTETAFAFGELYRRDGAWKFRAVGQGWASGLGGLATDFGISVDDSPPAAATPPPPPAPHTTPGVTPGSNGSNPAHRPPPSPTPTVSLKKQKLIDMEKRVAASAPVMLSLTKKAALSLEKRGLGEHTARVALVLDISGSMGPMYRSNKIQALAERVLALGLRFDDDGEVDVFLFGGKPHHADPITLANHANYTDEMLRSHRLESSTKYGAVMQMIRKHYFGSDGRRSTPMRQSTPVYVMFITDGATMDEAVTREQVFSSAFEPLFWMFMAIGNSSKAVDSNGRKGGLGARLARAASGDFKFLEELDDMEGRFLDNADFFAVQDPSNLSDEQLYELLTTEYPSWLTQARQRGLIG